MRLLLMVIVCVLWTCFPGISDAGDFGKYFDKGSLRVDFVLSGNSQGQSAAVSQLRREPVWGGPVRNLVDPFDYGHYRVLVYDKASGKLIYSRGFSTLFEEWRSTPQARLQTQAWTNSVSVPFPADSVRFEIQCRSNHDMEFRTILETDICPESIDIDRSDLKRNRVEALMYNGDPSTKVDMVFVAEGYTEDEQDKFVGDAKRFMDAMFAMNPFCDLKEDFNVWAVAVVSEESGTDFSGEGIFRNTALNSGFYTFGVDRYLTTRDMKAVRDAVWNVPNDAVFILVNDDTYGGSGMYNLYACGTSDNARTIEVFVHELGHSFAGLGDEYFTSEVAYTDFYSLEKEPWEPNITTMVDFESKWKDMLDVEGCGVFEGAGYSAKGIYRPADHCMMRDLVEFCPVCVRAIVRMTDYCCGREVK